MARILLADDDADMQEICARLFPKWGHSLTLAANAADAVKSAEAEMPDLILLDMRMPLGAGQDVSDTAGLDATLALKAIPRLAGVPIVVLTGHVLLADLRAMMLKAGCLALLTKPIMDYGKFRETLDAALRESRPL